LAKFCDKRLSPSVSKARIVADGQRGLELVRGFLFGILQRAFFVKV